MVEQTPRTQLFGASETVIPNPIQGIIGDVPVESIPLPSRGKLYPPTSAAHNVETVEIRPMTAHDEDILTSPALQKRGTVVTELLQGCLYADPGVKKINVRELVSGDRDALMIAIRSISYGSDYNAETHCPQCDNKEKHVFSLKLPMKRLEIDPIAPGLNAFPYTLPISKRNVIFRFLTVADEEEIMLTQERMKKSTNRQTNNLVTTRLQYSLLSVDGVDDKNKIAQFVKTMLAGDSLAFRRYADKHTPGVQMKQKIVCGACSEESEVILPLTSEFFYPTNDDEV